MSATDPALAAMEQLTGLFSGPGSLAVISRARDNGIVALSPGFAHLFGLSSAAARGRTAMELGLWRDAEQRAHMLETLRQRGAVTGEPMSLRAPDGNDYDGLVSCALIDWAGEAYIFALVQDIRRYHSESQARSREAESFRSLVMQSQVGVYRRRGVGRELSFANPALAALLGHESSDGLLQHERGRGRFDYVDAADGDAFDAAVAQGELPHRRVQLRRRDRSSVWVSESARAHYSSEGTLLYVEGTLLDISEQVRAESALVQSEMLYRNLVENSRDGVFLMQHGRIEFANDTLGSILGYEANELIGASYFDWVAPEDLNAQAQRKQARESGSLQTQEYEIRLLNRHGQKRVCAVRAGAVMFRGEPASIGTIRDITEARAQQQRLEAAEERYRLLFKHAVLGMFQSALNGDIIEVNEAMASLFGYPSPDAMRAEVGNMRACYADPGARERALAELMRNGRVVGWEFEMVHRDGSHFHVLASARVVRHHDEDPGHVEGSLLDNSARRRAEQELKFLALHDSLTQLPNRRSFEASLITALAELRLQPQQSRVVMLLDLDRFKLINDSLGHAAGDELLIKLSSRLLVELGSRALLARYGGDEFALLTSGPADRNGARALAERVRSVTAAPFQVQGHQIFTGASIGIVLVSDGQMQPDAIMRDVDTAMFRAKAQGGGYALFDRNMHAAARERLALETDLRFALERGELQAYYQPVWSLEEGRIVGVEALVRWQHPLRGLMVPGQFLGAAEDAGLLPAIDLLVLDLALSQWQQWRHDYGAAAPQTLSVNISDRLFASADFPAALEQRLKSLDCAPAQLQLEITETVFRGATQSLQQTLTRLKQIGVQLIVDDFGTGYSSLVSFSEAAFDGLKIDRGFIHDLESNPRHRAIVRTIAQFARDLGLSLVAEGVETEVQAETLRQAGCARAQGYLYAPPLAPIALARMLGQAAPEQGCAASA